MKDIHAVLRQKQGDVDRVRREIEALLAIIPILENDEVASRESVSPISVVPSAAIPKKPQQTERFSQLLRSWLSAGDI
jgi:hypothetical protein